MLKLYYSIRTRATRPRWMMEELGVKYDLVRINMQERQHKSPEYLKIHPHGLIPALADGDQVIFESAAICLYLADKFPEKQLAPPPTSAERGKYYQWVLYAIATVEQTAINYWQNAATSRNPESKRDAALAEDYRESFLVVCETLNNALWGNNFLLGNEITTADVLIGGALNMAKLGAGLPVDSFSQLGAYLTRLTSRDAFKRAHAD